MGQLLCSNYEQKRNYKDLFTAGKNNPLCILLGGNVPLRGNSVSILFISPEWAGIFYVNFPVLTQVTIETFEIPIFKI